MQNFGFHNLWEQGDFVLRSITVLLLLMSVLSWIVMLLKAYQVVRLHRVAKHARTTWIGIDPSGSIAAPNQPVDSPFRALAESAQQASQRCTEPVSGAERSGKILDASVWITHSLRGVMDDTTERLQSGLAVLASVGATAPFVGLLGTVWGIYHALVGIAVAGSANLEQVAGPVGEALIMTALGLMVAIPAVLGYNALNRQNRQLIAHMARYAHDLYAYLLTSGRMGPKPAGASA